MNERAILKGQLAELNQRLQDGEIRQKSLCERIGVSINPVIHEWRDMPVAEAAALMDDLVLLQAEMLAAFNKTEAIKKELYG